MQSVIVLAAIIFLIVISTNQVLSVHDITFSLNILNTGLETLQTSGTLSASDRLIHFTSVFSDGSFKSYYPGIFQHLRQLAGVEESSYVAALREDNLSCLKSDSKSGMIFWRSKDGTIVLKTLKHYECKTLRNMISSLHVHFSSGPSCIASVLGLYRVRTAGGKSRYFLATRNVFCGLSVFEKLYDLKGSTVGRIAANDSVVLKDVNLMTSGVKLGLGGDVRALVLNALARDAFLLRRYRLMDYSLLVAVEAAGESSAGNFEGIGSSTGIKKQTGLQSLVSGLLWRSPDDRGKIVVRGMDGKVYHLGIIDFLQRYTFRKHVETFLKGLIYDASKISAVNPDLYASRFHDFLAAYID